MKRIHKRYIKPKLPETIKGILSKDDNKNDSETEDRIEEIIEEEDFSLMNQNDPNISNGMNEIKENSNRNETSQNEITNNETNEISQNEITNNETSQISNIIQTNKPSLITNLPNITIEINNNQNNTNEKSDHDSNEEFENSLPPSTIKMNESKHDARELFEIRLSEIISIPKLSPSKALIKFYELLRSFHIPTTPNSIQSLIHDYIPDSQSFIVKKETINDLFVIDHVPLRTTYRNRSIVDPTEMKEVVEKIVSLPSKAVCWIEEIGYQLFGPNNDLEIIRKIEDPLPDYGVLCKDVKLSSSVMCTNNAGDHIASLEVLLSKGVKRAKSSRLSKQLDRKSSVKQFEGINRGGTTISFYERKDFIQWMQQQVQPEMKELRKQLKDNQKPLIIVDKYFKNMIEDSQKTNDMEIEVDYDVCYTSPEILEEISPLCKIIRNYSIQNSLEMGSDKNRHNIYQTLVKKYNRREMFTHVISEIIKIKEGESTVIPQYEKILGKDFNQQNDKPTEETDKYDTLPIIEKQSQIAENRKTNEISDGETEEMPMMIQVNDKQEKDSIFEITLNELKNKQSPQTQHNESIQSKQKKSKIVKNYDSFVASITKNAKDRENQTEQSRTSDKEERKMSYWERYRQEQRRIFPLDDTQRIYITNENDYNLNTYNNLNDYNYDYNDNEIEVHNPFNDNNYNEITISKIFNNQLINRRNDSINNINNNQLINNINNNNDKMIDTRNQTKYPELYQTEISDDDLIEGWCNFIKIKDIDDKKIFFIDTFDYLFQGEQQNQSQQIISREKGYKLLLTYSCNGTLLEPCERKQGIKREDFISYLEKIINSIVVMYYDTKKAIILNDYFKHISLPSSLKQIIKSKQIEIIYLPDAIYSIMPISLLFRKILFYCFEQNQRDTTNVLRILHEHFNSDFEHYNEITNPWKEIRYLANKKLFKLIELKLIIQKYSIDDDCLLVINNKNKLQDFDPIINCKSIPPIHREYFFSKLNEDASICLRSKEDQKEYIKSLGEKLNIDINGIISESSGRKRLMDN